ncbi:universal stress protein [Sphaerisporangium melleum]|uniref:Universal stress protein n=1 Tax=Sphaerisporangium melleum TaxID=321316 RepID=A0A917RLB1_9ACTN|nr:universal stress protein [Sphaerisporangium melleum]GGL13413.1 universal stress protein [Sphaerisporangium melleum]GII74496.1 universal stress protein [Sphaerisporangium melleum]
MGRPVVVGTDGSACSSTAVSWAAREARLRGAPLRVLYTALRWEYHLPLVPQPASWGPAAEAAARHMLDEAVALAREAGQGVEVTSAVMDGAAQDALTLASQDAQLLVVGHRGRGGLTGQLLGSVARHLAACAACPVVIVRGEEPGGGGEVVAGVAGRPDDAAVLEFAFQEAMLRRGRLRAVHAWTHPALRGPGDMQPLVYDIDAVGEEEARLLAETLAGWRRKYPDVDLIEDVVRAHPGEALLSASRGAGLLVIGARSGLRAVFGLGGTAHAVIGHATVPVAVVRP